MLFFYLVVAPDDAGYFGVRPRRTPIDEAATQKFGA
jgi:hypothetical protein